MDIKYGILYGVHEEDLNADGSFVVPNDVKYIGGYAFKYCSKLTSITIPDGVIGIGCDVFYGCSNLKSKHDNYKAFYITKTGKLMCRDKTYTIGKRSIVKGALKLCENGIHYCTNLFDIFNHYCGEYGKDFVVGICEVSNENLGADDDSKRCARWVKPTKILSREEVIKILNGDDNDEGY